MYQTFSIFKYKICFPNIFKIFRFIEKIQTSEFLIIWQVGPFFEYKKKRKKENFTQLTNKKNTKTVAANYRNICTYVIYICMYVYILISLIYVQTYIKK